MTRSTARRSPAPPSSPKAASMNFTAMPGNSSAMTSSTPTPSSAPPPDSPSPISSKTSSALPWAAPSAPGSFSFSAPTRAPARSTDSIPLPRQRQLLLPRHHRTVQAQSQAKPVRRYPGRPRPRQEAFLFRLLPGHPPDQRTRYHFLVNANSFFRATTGQSKPNLKQNQFGATLGGPVRARKLFFFGSYQGTRQINGLDTTSTSNPILPPLTNDRSAAALAARFCPAN